MTDTFIRILYVITAFVAIYFLVLAIRKFKAADAKPDEIETTLKIQAETITALSERNELLERFQRAREGLPTTVNVTGNWKFEVWLVDRILPGIDIWRAAKLVSLVNDEPVYTLEARIVNLGKWTIHGITGHTFKVVDGDSFVLCSISERHPDQLVRHGVYPKTTDIFFVPLTTNKAFWTQLDHANRALINAFIDQLPAIFSVTQGNETKAYAMGFENGTPSLTEISRTHAVPYLGLESLWGSIAHAACGKRLTAAQHFTTVGARYTPTERIEWTLVEENDHWDDPYRWHLVETRHTRDDFIITALRQNCDKLSAVFSEYVRCYMAVSGGRGEYVDERLPETVTFAASQKHGFWHGNRINKDDSATFYCEQNDGVLVVANGIPELLRGYHVHNTIDDYGRNTLALVLTNPSDQTVTVYDLIRQKALMQPTRGIDLNSVTVKGDKVNLTLN